MATGFTKLSPKQLQALGYSRASERYQTSTGDIISKRQYQKQTQKGTYNPSPFKQVKYTRLAEQSRIKRAETKAWNKEFQTTGRNLARDIRKLKDQGPNEWGSDASQKIWKRLMEKVPKHERARLRQIIYSKYAGKKAA